MQATSSTQPRTALRRSRENENNNNENTTTTGQPPFTCIVILRHILSFAAVNAHVFLFTLPQINMSCRETVDSFLDHEWQRLFGGIVKPTGEPTQIHEFARPRSSSLFTRTRKSRQSAIHRASLAIEHEASAAIARSIAGCADMSKSWVVANLLRLRDKSNDNDGTQQERPAATPQAFLDLLVPHLGNEAWCVLLAARSDVVFDHLCDVATRRQPQAGGTNNVTTNLADSDKEWRCKEIRRIIINLRGFLDPCPTRELAMNRVPRLLEIAVHWLPHQTSETEAKAWLDVLIPLLHFAISGDFRPLQRRTLQLLNSVVARTGHSSVFGAAATPTQQAVNGILSAKTIDELFVDICRGLHRVLGPMRAEVDRLRSAPQQATATTATAPASALSNRNDHELLDDDAIVKYGVFVTHSMFALNRISASRPVDNAYLRYLDDLVTIVLRHQFVVGVGSHDFRNQTLNLLSRIVRPGCSAEIAQWACCANVRLWKGVCSVLQDVAAQVRDAMVLVEVLFWRGTVAAIHGMLKHTELLDRLLELVDQNRDNQRARALRLVSQILNVSTAEFNFKKMLDERNFCGVLRTRLGETRLTETFDTALDIAKTHYRMLLSRE